jgi:hypothetical protein
VTRTFWLSFSDPDRPAGQRFLGVAVIDVTTEEAATAEVVLRMRHPHAKEGAEWVWVAQQKAWQLGINPGGEIGVTELPRTDPRVAAIPRDRLMQKPELEALGVAARVH